MCIITSISTHENKAKISTNGAQKRKQQAQSKTIQGKKYDTLKKIG